MWNSDIPLGAPAGWPKRDLTGEPFASKPRLRPLVAGMERDALACPGVPNDEFDLKFAGFYGPPIQGEFNNANVSKSFQGDWLARVQELVDKHEPQMVYYDNCATQWGKQGTEPPGDQASRIHRPRRPTPTAQAGRPHHRGRVSFQRRRQ